MKLRGAPHGDRGSRVRLCGLRSRPAGADIGELGIFSASGLDRGESGCACRGADSGAR